MYSFGSRNKIIFPSLHIVIINEDNAYEVVLSLKKEEKGDFPD